MSKEVQRLKKALENNEKRIERLGNIEILSPMQKVTLESLPLKREGIEKQIALLEEKGAKKRIGVVIGFGYNTDVISTVWESYEQAFAHVAKLVGRDADLEYVSNGVLTAEFYIKPQEHSEIGSQLFSLYNCTTEMEAILVRSVKFGNFPIGSYEI